MQVFFSNCYMLSRYALYRMGKSPECVSDYSDNKSRYVNFAKCTKALEDSICKDLAYKAVEACAGIGTAKELQAIEEVFVKGGLAVEYFKQLHPFMVACLQESLSMPIINILIKHGMYDPDWADRRNIVLNDREETSLFARSRSINIPGL